MAGRYDVRPPSPTVMLVLATLVVLMIFPVHGQAPHAVQNVMNPAIGDVLQGPGMLGRTQGPRLVPPAPVAAEPVHKAGPGSLQKVDASACGRFSADQSRNALAQASVPLPKRLYACQSRTLGSIPYGQYRRHWHKLSWNIILPVSEASQPPRGRTGLPWTTSLLFSEKVQVGRVLKGQYERNPAELYSTMHNFSGSASFSMFGGFRAPLVDMSFEFFADKLMAVLHPQPTVVHVQVNCVGCPSGFVLDPVGDGPSIRPGAALPQASGQTNAVRGRNGQFRELAPGVVFEPINKREQQGPNGGMIAGVIIGVLVVAGIVIIIAYIWWKRRVRMNLQKQQTQTIADRRKQQVKPHLVTGGGQGGGNGLNYNSQNVDRKPTFPDLESTKPSSTYDAELLRTTPSGKYDPIPSSTSHLTTMSGQPKDNYNSLTVSSFPATQPSVPNMEAELYQNHTADMDAEEVENAVQPGPKVIAELSSELYMRQKMIKTEDELALPTRQRTSTLSTQELTTMAIHKPSLAAKPTRPPRRQDSTSSGMSSLKRFVQRLQPEGVAALSQIQRSRTPVNENPLDRDGYIVPDVRSPGTQPGLIIPMSADPSLLGGMSPSATPPPLPRKPDARRQQSRSLDYAPPTSHSPPLSPLPPPRSLPLSPSTQYEQSTPVHKASTPTSHRPRSNTRSSHNSNMPGQLGGMDRTRTGSTVDSGFLGSSSALGSNHQQRHLHHTLDNLSTDTDDAATVLDDYQNPLDARDGLSRQDSPIDYENLQFAADGASDGQSRHDYVEPLDKLPPAGAARPASLLSQQDMVQTGSMNTMMNMMMTSSYSAGEDQQTYSEVEMDDDPNDNRPPARKAKPSKKKKPVMTSNANAPMTRKPSLYDPSLFENGGLDYRGDMDIVYDNVSDMDEASSAGGGAEYELTGKPASLAAEQDIEGIYTYAGLPRTKLSHVKNKQRPRTAMAAMKSLKKKKA